VRLYDNCEISKTNCDTSGYQWCFSGTCETYSILVGIKKIFLKLWVLAWNLKIVGPSVVISKQIVRIEANAKVSIKF
jgi:hypothetical protein